MTFYDTVNEMGYKMSKTEEIIELVKEDNYIGHEPLGEIHIVFYIRAKQIMGYIKPLRNFFDLDDLSHIYHNLFLSMEKDLKFFSDKSKYDIIK